jgi:glycosyltransferase involved in cell wall biosynthesis
LRRAKIGVAPNLEHAIGTAFTSPLKIFEYLAAGKPVLASDLPSLHEVLDKDVARFFAPRSPRSLAVAAEKLLCDDAEMARMSRAAKELAAHHTWSRRAERITEFVADLPSFKPV